MSLAAAITPSTCLSVSAICFTAGGWPMGAAPWAGAILACASALLVDKTAMEAVRQTMLKVTATGRMNSRMCWAPRAGGYFEIEQRSSTTAREMNGP